MSKLRNFINEENSAEVLSRWSLPTRVKISKALSLLNKKLKELNRNYEMHTKNSPEQAYCLGIYYGVYSSYATINARPFSTLEQKLHFIEKLSEKEDLDYPLTHLNQDFGSYAMPYDDNELNEKCMEGYIKGLSEGKTIVWCSFKNIPFLELLLKCLIKSLEPLPETENF